MNKNYIFMAILSAMISCMAATAAADELHYTNLLIGDRASGMGGAYTAVSDDATGLYYNPAGIAYAVGRNFSASVNAFYDNVKTYKNVLSNGNGYTRKSSSLLPNYFGVVQPLGRFKVGLSYAVPDSITEDQQQTVSNFPLNPSIQPFNPGANISSYTVNYKNEYNVYNFGPSIATELTDNFSAGLTLYYYQKTQSYMLNQLTLTSNGGYELIDQYFHTNEWGVRPILGFMWSPMNAVSIGLAFSKIFIEGSNTNFMNTYVRNNIAIDNNPEDTNRTILPNGASGSNAKREYPTQISLGAAWFPTASLLVSGDIKYFTKVNEQDFVVNGQSYVLRQYAEPVTNYALGTEYYFTKNWAIRAGLYTDKSNAENVETGGINQPEHVDLYGGTLSISSFSRNTSVTLGGGITDGTGKAQILSNSTNIQDTVSRSWTLFLSSTYSY
jgi:long-subunit fatty acid transport protein